MMAKEILVNDGEFVGEPDYSRSSNHDTMYVFRHKDGGYACSLWGEEVETLWESEKLEEYIQMLYREELLLQNFADNLRASGSEDIPF